jgi:hypothetical protein
VHPLGRDRNAYPKVGTLRAIKASGAHVSVETAATEVIAVHGEVGGKTRPEVVVYRYKVRKSGAFGTWCAIITKYIEEVVFVCALDF